MKRGYFLALLSVVVLCAVIAALSGAQVFPPRWQEEPQPLLPAVGAGVVALGSGAIGLNPDQTVQISPFGGSTAGKKVVDASCSSSNRGEIRLLNLSDEGLVSPASNIDAFCFCQRSVIDGQAATYAWSCFKTQ